MSNRKSGFSLMELLVVIAIITVLTALLFPAISSVKEGARKTKCLTQMHDIAVAIKQYHDDNNAYPPALLGFAEPGKTINQMTARPLFGSKYLRDSSIFLCDDNTEEFINSPDTVQPVYPAHVALTGNAPNTYYKADAYDVGPQLDDQGQPVLVGGNPKLELHYSLDWTGGSGASDKPNQLKYLVPLADHTVITWCTYHEFTAGTNMVNVLMLSGTAKTVPAATFAAKGPLDFNP